MPQPDVAIDIVIVGAGVAGLVSAATLSRTGSSVLLLDRRAPDDAHCGADLALWPGAITILKALGVPRHFFSAACYALDTVHMCNMRFNTNSATADILTTIDMRAVTDGTGEAFALVSRPALMLQLQALVPENVEVRYGCNVTAVNSNSNSTTAQTVVQYEDADGATHQVTGRVVLGCDGARSRVRSAMVAPTAAPAVFCGEMVYRGVLTLSQGADKDIGEIFPFPFPDDAAARTMRINYGAGVRSSFGLMSGDGNLAYWWVKQPALSDNININIVNSWPEILRRLYRATPQNNRYVHPVQSAPPLPSWCCRSPPVALVGDAAHLVTPNMGQGACLAVEDAFVLSVLLTDTDTDIDAALDEYERVRKPFADGVASEARKQLLIGQLTWWPLVWLRDRALRFIPPSILVRKLKANNFDAQEYIDRFQAQVTQYKAPST